MAGAEKLLDDLARLAGGAAGTIGAMRGQMKDDLRARLDNIALRLDLVPRAEFERLEAMLAQSRIEQENLKKRLDALEASIKPAKTQKTASKLQKTAKKTAK
ncbi:MAG: accessory factor UbiK family protein [Alphaproteobacteria bacterium]